MLGWLLPNKLGVTVVVELVDGFGCEPNKSLDGSLVVFVPNVSLGGSFDVDDDPKSDLLGSGFAPNKDLLGSRLFEPNNCLFGSIVCPNNDLLASDVVVEPKIDLFCSVLAPNVNGLLGSAVVDVMPLANKGLFSSVVVDEPNNGLLASVLVVFAVVVDDGGVKKLVPNVEIVEVVSVLGVDCTVD